MKYRKIFFICFTFIFSIISNGNSPINNNICETNTQQINKKYLYHLHNLCLINNTKKNNNTIIETNSIPSNIKFELIDSNNNIIKKYEPSSLQIFPEKYSDIEGIPTFRGNNLRNCSSYGICNINYNTLNLKWSFNTSSGIWGSGAGWTGQPSIVKWSEDVKKIMNIKESFKNKKDFVEVIYACLDGKIYFMDLDSGKETREPIDIQNPIKGSVSVDSRGYPLLYVGQGIPQKGCIGYRIFNLINGKELYFIKGLDNSAFRNWGAFDGSPLINKDTDTMILGGENGLFYNIKLNTKFNIKNGYITINPEIIKYRYNITNNQYQGIENSVAAYKNLAYFADNGGSIQCINLQNMKPVWDFNTGDDTDATLTIEIKDDIPYIYTANEVDKQGTVGISYIRKINGITGRLVFEKAYKAYSLIGANPVNGGALATNIIGKNDIDDLVIFNIARYKYFNSGILAALNKETGEEVWRLNMDNYSWSSPCAVYDEKGKSYLVQGDSCGNIFLIEGKSGKILNSVNVGTNIESSPAIYNNTLVVASRYGRIFAFTLE